MLTVLTNDDLNWIHLLYFIPQLDTSSLFYLWIEIVFWIGYTNSNYFSLFNLLQPGIMQSAAGFIGISNLLMPFHVSLAPFS